MKLKTHCFKATPRRVNSKLKTTTGQAMLLTVLILCGSILGASTIAGYLMLLKIRNSSDITNSTKAIFAAETGIEWELYKQFKDGSNYPEPSLSNNTDFTSSNDGTVIKSIGQSLNSYRAFEVQITFEMQPSGATSTLPASP